MAITDTVSFLTMDPDAAAAKVEAFRADTHDDTAALYTQVADVYAALADGRDVVNVDEAIQRAPVDHKGRPLRAIARADRRQVRMRWNWEQVEFDTSARFNGRIAETVQMDRSDSNWKTGYSLVPMVPADVRPATGQLREWHILFEVDQWHDSPVIDVPTDPLLLKRIYGPFFEVLAVWDLTEVERSVLAHFRASERAGAR